MRQLIHVPSGNSSWNVEYELNRSFGSTGVPGASDSHNWTKGLQCGNSITSKNNYLVFVKIGKKLLLLH